MAPNSLSSEGSPSGRVPEQASNLAEFTVSELAFSLKRTVEDAFGLVRVRGELSGFKRASSGHLYFALKDDRAVLDGVCWRGAARKITIELEDGLEVICTGQLTTYPARSRYQLVVESIEPAGIGALMALLEERRKKLQAEGLFDEERKRALPFLPETIGIVTSPTGAVIRDILHRIEERFPCRILLWPVMVQGQGAAEQITRAINGFDAWPGTLELPRPDLLIVARGGGSIEDLWSFNEEAVVRAVSACTIPVISAVGHETDTTLVDYAADRRAPTPTAAAEMAVPVRRDLLNTLGGLEGRLSESLQRNISQRGDYLRGLARGLPDPKNLVELNQQRIDELAERHGIAVHNHLHRLELQGHAMARGLRPPIEMLRDRQRTLTLAIERAQTVIKDHMRDADREHARAGQRLGSVSFGQRLMVAESGWQTAIERLRYAFETRRNEWTRRFETAASMLESLSHRSALERGYALVRSSASSQLVRTAHAARGEPSLSLEFADGGLLVRPCEDDELPASQSTPAKPSGKKARRNQGELF